MDPGIIIRESYLCGPHTATCILVPRLAYPASGMDMKFMFGIRASVLYEVYRDVVEKLMTSQRHLLSTLTSAIVRLQSEMYSADIKESDCLPYLFIDAFCTL